jgi:hypothetical protein
MSNSGGSAVGNCGYYASGMGRVAVGWTIDGMLTTVDLNDRQHCSIVISGGELIIFRNWQWLNVCQQTSKGDG